MDQKVYTRKQLHLMMPPLHSQNVVTWDQNLKEEKGKKIGEVSLKLSRCALWGRKSHKQSLVVRFITKIKWFRHGRKCKQFKLWITFHYKQTWFNLLRCSTWDLHDVTHVRVWTSATALLTNSSQWVKNVTMNSNQFMYQNQILDGLGRSS